MRLATLRTPAGHRAAVKADGSWALLDEPDVGTLLRNPAWVSRARDALSGAGHVSEEAVDVGPLVPRPGKIICVGLNYRGHIEEMGREIPRHPTLFAKFSEALVGAYDDIVLPRASTRLDWEAELAVVVGSPLKDADEETAEGAIAGYCVANDVTARDWQYRTTQWLQGKTFEATTPLGPELVTPDEVGDVGNARLRCSLNGTVVQDAVIGDLVFSPAALTAYVSTICTLQPGDVLLTGTPAGVGHARDPQLYLAENDRLVTEIEGIGRCENRCAGPETLPRPEKSRRTERKETT